MNAPLIAINRLHKTFSSSLYPWLQSKKTNALSDINLSIDQGERVALLGANGAGKTTLLKILSTATIPDTGTVTVNDFVLGKNDNIIKSLIGFVANEDRSFYWRLTGRQNLEFFAALYGLSLPQATSRIDELFGSFHIDYANKRFDAYSTGMKRKFALMRALIHDPRILLLDEPTKSLDHSSSMEFREYILDHAHAQRTILMATHDFEEAEHLCDRFIILHHGCILGQGTLKDLQQQTGLPSASLSEVTLKLTNYVK